MDLSYVVLSPYTILVVALALEPSDQFEKKNKIKLIVGFYEFLTTNEKLMCQLCFENVYKETQASIGLSFPLNSRFELLSTVLTVAYIHM